MKQFRVWMSLALIACTLASFVVPVDFAKAEDWGIITGSYVNIRTAPSGTVIRNMAKNTDVQVLGKSGNWYQIYAPVYDVTGYVYKDYLKLTEKAPDTVPTAAPEATPTPKPETTQAPVAGKPAATLLRYGMKGEDVKLLQAKLKELGYFTYHTCTGNFASATREAVKAFQRAQGLTADGIAGPLTLGKLWPAEAATPTPAAPTPTPAAPTPTPEGKPDEGDTQAPADATPTPEVTPTPEATATPEVTPTAAPTPTPAPTAKPEYNYILRKGMTDARVNELQKELKAQGYFPANTNCTNYYGTVTYNAVVAFQKAKGLTADGVAGPLTLTALFGGSTASPETTTKPEGGNINDGASAGDVNYTFAHKDFEVTLKLGSTGVHVKDLQYALYLKGYYKGSITGTFDSATKTAVIAHQKKAGLKQDGIAGEETLCTLYTLLDPLPEAAVDLFRFDKGEDIACEILDWSDATNCVPRNSIATIVDVKTGYSFQVKRTGGSKHADMETLESLDTNIMYACYNYKWSWTRRPIWVIYNGHKYAASMNGMPHGYDTIGGNDLAGQFCVHFINSRTHGTNHLDADHQNAVQEAYKASVLKVESNLAK